MLIAILGATSQIARDYISDAARSGAHEYYLFARNKEAVLNWLRATGCVGNFKVCEISSFPMSMKWDAVLNFVGVGNPAQAARMGREILAVTEDFDRLSLDFVQRNPACRYVFLSSGAAYGGKFVEPASEDSVAAFNINALGAQDWYGLAKFQAECRHRAMGELPAFDLRVFSYFSASQDLSARFLISDAVRAIDNAECLKTSPQNIVRDYIGAGDFGRLLDSILSSPPSNDVIDCYSKAPIDKFSLLEALKSEYGLSYEIERTGDVGINATGVKQNYFSINRRAALYGFLPEHDSKEVVLNGVSSILEGGCQ